MSDSPYDHAGHRDLCHEDPAAADAIEAWYRKRQALRHDPVMQAREKREARLDASNRWRELREADGGA